MKNSGSSFVKEVATREFMEEVTHLIKVPVSFFLYDDDILVNGLIDWM